MSAAAQDFSRDVQPIFKRRCIACHGAGMQTNGLRLDDGSSILRGGYSGPSVVAGKPADSLLLKRVTSAEKGFMMPPAGARLTTEEVALITKWIESGANVPASTMTTTSRRSSNHWAFQPVARPANKGIDDIVRVRLAKEKLTPSPEADRHTLIRRLKLDLLGLPPSPEEVQAFIEDKSPNAWERLVDSFLASPHYGERWARPWLDLARYADSDGYEKDQVRPHAWRYRHWVINALNADMPFDRFTIEQIAGDLLPGSTVEQKVATGFHRNVLVNREAGVDRAEARFEQLINRTNTVATTWLGLTAGCAQCHDHKYDPFSQKDYYQLLAFFNEADDVNIDAPLAGEMGPYLKALPAYRAEREKLLNEYKIPELQARWEAKMRDAYANPGRDAEFDFWITSMSATVDHAMRLLHKKDRSERERDIVTNYFTGNPGPEFNRDKEVTAKLKELREKLGKITTAFPSLTQAYTIGVHQDHPKTHIAMRGDHRSPGIAVTPDAPSVLPAMKGDTSRLSFAKWLVAPENPLTARVTVNRAWQEFFGRGIVKTSEDFGATGDKPSHPELLDWLASDFVAKGWSMKALHKTIVMSATYKQSSKYRAEVAAVDPENALLARQSRLRIPAENIRDSVLYISQTLNPEVGGKSVMPYLPKGVGELAYGGTKWRETTGRDAYRRGVYIHHQRTTPYPLLVNFDAPDSSVACARRRSSNTPLQALNLLNDPLFVEAANALAVRTTAEADTPGARIDRMFQLALGRPPRDTEKQKLSKYLDAQSRDPQVWTGLARILFNLDEFVNRE